MYKPHLSYPATHGLLEKIVDGMFFTLWMCFLILFLSFITSYCVKWRGDTHTHFKARLLPLNTQESHSRDTCVNRLFQHGYRHCDKAMRPPRRKKDLWPEELSKFSARPQHQTRVLMDKWELDMRIRGHKGPSEPRELHMSRHGKKREGTCGEWGIIERPGSIPWRHQRKRKYATEPQPIIVSMEVNIKSNLNFLGHHTPEVKGEITWVVITQLSLAPCPTIDTGFLVPSKAVPWIWESPFLFSHSPQMSCLQGPLMSRLTNTPVGIHLWLCQRPSGVRCALPTHLTVLGYT